MCARLLLLLLLLLAAVLGWLSAGVLQLSAVLGVCVRVGAVHSRVIVTIIVLFGGFLCLPDDGSIPYRAVPVVVRCRDEGHLCLSNLNNAAISQERLGTALQEIIVNTQSVPAVHHNVLFQAVDVIRDDGMRPGDLAIGSKINVHHGLV